MLLTNVVIFFYFCHLEYNGFMDNRVVRWIFTAVLSLAAMSSVQYAYAGTPDGRQYRRAVKLYEKGAYAAARVEFGDLLKECPGNEDLAAYHALSSVRAGGDAAIQDAEAFFEAFPASKSVHLVNYHIACNYFDERDYVSCMKVLERLDCGKLPEKDRPGCGFRLAYSYMMEGYYAESSSLFLELAALGRKKLGSLYVPVYYSAGYLLYRDGKFSEAMPYFEAGMSDLRFRELSMFYLMECNYMLKDYGKVVEIGSGNFSSLQGSYKKNAARMLSEAYMLLGKKREAGEFYEKFSEAEEGFGREDYYFAGMVAYSLGKYSDAVSDFSKVVDVKDSITQSAYYYQGYSHIQTGNKLAALASLKEAAAMDYDAGMKEDAMFNYAKLVFDVNEDLSGFSDYLAQYGSSTRSDEVYSYIASAYSAEGDYASAIDAYMKIGKLSYSAREDFRRALFMRSMQLISSGSYSRTIPLLKRITALHGGDRMAFLADYWLAEAYYRNDEFEKAIEINSALKADAANASVPEYGMLDYNLGYDYFKLGDYGSSEKYFRRFLSSSPSSGRREAMMRLADCLFMQGKYPEAAGLYEDCSDSFYDRSDIYPLYQAALAYGLVPMEAKKIAMLERAREFSPDVKYYDYAMFELGRSYIKIDDDVRAEEVFLNLKDNSKDSAVIAVSCIELGSLYRNRLEYDRALKYYKEVVSQMPSSIYCQDALAAIEAIYTASGNPQAYLAYIDSIGKSYLKSEDEKEDMIFNAAEQQFLKNDYQAAILALEAYLEKYPSASKRSQAYFYIAESQKALGRYEKAVNAYYKVMEIGEGAFAESAILNYAELSYKLERYMQAYEGYTTLAGMALLDNNRYVGLLGIMRSEYKMKEYAAAIEAADSLEASPFCDENALRELRYVKAKSYIALSDREQAASLLAVLAEEPATPEGAEANYLIIQETYDSGRFEDVENLVYDFSASASPQTYFLAKAFIVLGDSFAERDEWEQAKATFESILQNYASPEEGDDIVPQVKMRLEKMAEMGL